mgnify:CR=1 FL=1
MDYMYELKDMLCEELEMIVGKGELSHSSLDMVQKITDTIKNIDKIEMLEGQNSFGGSYGGSYGDDEGYSERRRYSRDGGNSYRGDLSYDDGGDSYRRGRNQMGQYTSRAYRGYSREGGKERMISQLRSMMNTAENEKEKESINKCIKSLENS